MQAENTTRHHIPANALDNARGGSYNYTVINYSVIDIRGCI